jgi:hypothetical protein
MIRKCDDREQFSLLSSNPRSSFLRIKDIQPVPGTGSVANSQLGSGTLPCCIGSAGQEKKYLFVYAILNIVVVTV